ncbi:MAG TPA: serine hydrolase domain-containing protein [Candidatus Bathyarchaeia archaeon]|nr:serine hydrolase domain-containing protein [Candidatus Bathyarchaeia archaeon]
MSTQIFPSTSAGRAAHELVKAINSGKKELQRLFLDTRLSEAGKRERPLDESASLLQKAFEQSGGIIIDKVERSEPNPFVFYARSMRGNHWTRVFLFMDKIEEGKIREFGFLPIRAYAEDKETLWPEKRLTDDLAKREIERHVFWLAKRDIFSGVVLVAHGYTRFNTLVGVAVGNAEKSFESPNRIDTKFNIGSINKMFTSVSIAQLIEKGAISLQDKLGDLIPGYPNGEASRSVTVYHLLSHQAGLGGLFERPKYDNRKKYQTNMELLSIFADQLLLYEPGTRSMYSNEGYIVLGSIVEEVTGEDYHDYVRKNILQPADMQNTGPYALDEHVPNLAVGYLQAADDPFGLDPRRPNHMFLGWRGNACGGGYSTGPDLVKFANALKTHKLVGSKLTDEFTRQQGGMKNYGLGFEVEEFNGKRVVGHTGGGPNSGVNCALKTFWDSQETVVVVGNYDAPVAQDLATDIVKFLSNP